MRIHSYVTWFEEEDYVGTVVSFPSGSWKLDRKVTENESFNDQFEWENYKLCSEARAVFTCSKVSGDGPADAVIKIYMQIPWIGSVNKKSAIRAQQACSARFSKARAEVEALSIFTKKNCSSTPKLLDSKHTKQADDQWIPGGFMWYILMERLPGINPELPFQVEMDRAERDALRVAFKAAWIECVACGLVHADSASRNLLWDKEHNKCYILDWECYYEAGESNVWKDSHYIGWHLARRGKSESFDDMSEWIL